MPRNPKSKPAAAAKPVRAWVSCGTGEGPIEANASRMRLMEVGEVHLHNLDATWRRPVLILDPRTHRAVAIKKARGK